MKMPEWLSILLAVFMTSALILGSGYLSGDEMQQTVGRAIRTSFGLAFGLVLGFRFWNRRKERGR